MNTERVALSPKKLRSSNILPANDCPTSPTKKSRAVPYQVNRSPRKHRPTSPVDSCSSTRILRSANHTISSPPKLSPFKVFSDQTVYNLHLDSQLAENKDLVLSPPSKSNFSPSPRKRPSLSPQSSKRPSRIPRPICATIAENRRVQCKPISDLTTSNKFAFLTPPRPRFHFNSREASSLEDRISKSASPKLGRSGLGLRNDSMNGFTIYVDSGEYFSLVNTDFDLGIDVNKENGWLIKQGIPV